MSWDEDQDLEAEWWGDCANTFGEELKQTVYADRMGLIAQNIDGHWPVYDLEGKSVLDIGGGPASLLLKTINNGPLFIADPCPYPQWVSDRYIAAGILYAKVPGEDLFGEFDFTFDEVWIYNVLQHTQDPELILKNALSLGERVRILEWIDIPPHPGHPHELTQEMLDAALGVQGTVEEFHGEYGMSGRGYYVYTTREK